MQNLKKSIFLTLLSTLTLMGWSYALAEEIKLPTPQSIVEESSEAVVLESESDEDELKLEIKVSWEF